MRYELVIIPMDYKEHINLDKHSTCIMCSEELSIIDEFINVKDMPEADTEYEGLLSICTSCGVAHLEVLNAVLSFDSPVLIDWK